jgi:hypothetical protein
MKGGAGSCSPANVVQGELQEQLPVLFDDRPEILSMVANFEALG